MGPKAAHLRGYINRGGRLKTLILVTVHTRQALGRPRGPSSPDCGTSSRTCGLRGGAALAAQVKGPCLVLVIG